LLEKMNKEELIELEDKLEQKMKEKGIISLLERIDNQQNTIREFEEKLEAKIKENDKLKEEKENLKNENQEMKKKLTKLFDLITELHNEIVVIKWI